jgi:hypothetical protein
MSTNGAPSNATPARLIAEVRAYLEAKFASLEFALYPNCSKPTELIIGHPEVRWEVQFLPQLHPAGQVEGYHLTVFSKDGSLSGNTVFHPADDRHGATAEDMVRLAFGDRLQTLPDQTF